MSSPRSPEVLDTPAVLRLAQQVNPQGNATSSEILVALRRIFPRMASVYLRDLRERVLSATGGSADGAEEDDVSEDDHSDESDSDVVSEVGADIEAHAQGLGVQVQHLATQQTCELGAPPVAESISAADADAQDGGVLFDSFTEPQPPEFVGKLENNNEESFGERGNNNQEVDDLFGEHMSETKDDGESRFGEPITEADNDDIDSLFDEANSHGPTATSLLTSRITATTSYSLFFGATVGRTLPSPAPKQKLSQYLPPSPKQKPAARLALPKPGLALPPPSRKFTIPELPVQSVLPEANASTSRRTMTATTPLSSSMSPTNIPAVRAYNSIPMARALSSYGTSLALPPILRPQTPTERPVIQQTATPPSSSAVSTPLPKARKPEPRYRCRYGCPLKGGGQTGPQLRRHMNRTHNLYHPKDQDDLKPCLDGPRGCARLHLEKDKSHPCIQNNAGSPGKWCSSRSEKCRALDERDFYMKAPRDLQEIADTFAYADGPSPSILVLVQGGDDEDERQKANKRALEEWEPRPPRYGLLKSESPQKCTIKRSRDDTEDTGTAQPRSKLARVDSGFSMGPTVSPSPVQIPTYVSPYNSQPSSQTPTPVPSSSRPSGYQMTPQRSEAPSFPPYSLFAPSSTRANAVPDAPVQNTMRPARAAQAQQLQPPGYPAPVHPSNVQPGPLRSNAPAYGVAMQTRMHPTYAAQSQHSRLPQPQWIGQYNNGQPGAHVSNAPTYRMPNQAGMRVKYTAQPQQSQVNNGSQHIGQYNDMQRGTQVTGSQVTGSQHIGQYNNMQPGSHVSNTHIYLPSVHNGMQPAPTFHRQPQRPSSPSQNTAITNQRPAPPANTRGPPMLRTQYGIPPAPRPQPRQLHHLGNTPAAPAMAPTGHYVSPYAPVHDGMLPMQMQPARPMQAPQPQQGSHVEDPFVVD
ncbi:hypothetical protein LTR95_005259 [Oleoguttula sp. CCFEE 5521]